MAIFALCFFYCFLSAIAERSPPAEEEDGTWVDEEEMRRPMHSLEVRASAHLKRRSQWADRHEGLMQDELDALRQERGRAESLEASERHEARLLAQRLRAEDEAMGIAADKERHARELLQVAKHELARKSQEVASTHAALAHSRAAASEAVRRARHKAKISQQEAADERLRARREAEADRRAAEELRKAYEEKVGQAEEAQALAEQEMEKSVAEQQLERAALQRQQKEAARAKAAVGKAEEERQQHFKAAAAMRQETEQAQALVEDAGREKAAFQRQKRRARLAEQQAKSEWSSASSLAFMCYGMLALAVVGAAGFSIQIHKGEGPHPLLSLLFGLPSGYKAIDSSEAVPCADDESQGATCKPSAMPMREPVADADGGAPGEDDEEF